MSNETFADQELCIEVTDVPDGVYVRWSGKSTSRDPGQFILPLLAKAIDRGRLREQPIVIDFRDLDYMNSSTITPIIRSLEVARGSGVPCTLLYKKDLRWQVMSFTALEVFQTSRSKIRVQGL